MSVIYAPKGGGLGNGLGIVGTLLSFVPGMQGVGKGLSAVGAAANGDYVGAAKAASGIKTPTQTAQSVPLVSSLSSPDRFQQIYREFNLGR